MKTPLRLLESRVLYRRARGSAFRAKSEKSANGIRAVMFYASPLRHGYAMAENCVFFQWAPRKTHRKHAEQRKSTFEPECALKSI